jgi:hypothetical protein
MAITNNYEILSPGTGKTQQEREFLDALGEAKNKSATVQIGTTSVRGIVNLQADFNGADYSIDGSEANFVFKKNEARVDMFMYANIVLDSPPQDFYAVAVWLPEEFQYAGIGTPFALNAQFYNMDKESYHNLTCMAWQSLLPGDPFFICSVPGATLAGGPSPYTGGVSVSNYIRLVISGYFYRKTSSRS